MRVESDAGRRRDAGLRLVRMLLFHREMRWERWGGSLAIALGAAALSGCAAGDGGAPASDVEAEADRGDATIVRVVAEAARVERVPRDVLLALGWAETRLEPRAPGLAPGAHEADDGVELEAGADAAAQPASCGVFGLDEGEARAQAASLVGATSDALCEAPDLEARAAAARLRALAGGDDAPPLSELGAWVAALDDWHPELAARGFPYGEYLVSVLAYGIDASDAVGASIELPATHVELPPRAAVAGARAYARPDTPLAHWRGPACHYAPASRTRGDVRYVVIHTCEGGFAGCLSTLARLRRIRPSPRTT